jgi:hypothetical protein
LGTAGATPWTFIVCAALIFFTWGEIFSLFPSTCTDMFGPKYATTNTSLLYTAKGTVGLCRAFGERAKRIRRWLARCVYGRRDHEFPRGIAGAVRGAADSAFDQRVGTKETGAVSQAAESEGDLLVE